jgi:Undecaprenyl-phosphate glucose phosphotransferase
LWSGIGAVALAFSFLLSILFLLKTTEHYSRATFFFQVLTVGAAVLGGRVISHARIQAAIAVNRIEARRAVLMGDAVRHARIVERLRDAGIRIVRYLPFPDEAERSTDREHASPARAEREEVRGLIEICRAAKIDDVVMLATASALPTAGRLADLLAELPVSLHLVPVDAEELLGPAQLGEIGSLVTIQLLRPPLTAFHRLVKRAFDVAAASLGIVLLAPVLAAVAAAIKLDSRGPVFFRQTRHGYNNQAIRVFKFRTMSTMEDGQAFRQAKPNDPRITRVGHFLRRTNIDELPQLLNVLLGQMSIVGPRPHPVALNQLFEQHIAPLSRRHNVKPGITGWAQVNGYRGQTDTLEKMQRRFEYDLYYIDNWSFLLDVKIIIMTIFSRSAYVNAF